MPVFVPQSFKFALFQYYIAVKYSPPIEAGASFNPPNLAKDCILRASVSEAMGFFMRQTLPVLPTVLLSYGQLLETSMSIF